MRLNRAVGIELEGYVTTSPHDIQLEHAEIGKDQSLNYSEWYEYHGIYGIEAKTIKLYDTDIIESIFNRLLSHGWHVDERAGTHIHVDISDYSERQKALLLRFGKGIERIIFMFVEKYRSYSDFCYKLHYEWRKIFWANSVFNQIDWERAEELGLSRYFDQGYNNIPFATTIYNSKYSWMNVLGSRYTTCEFRLFHAAKSAKEVINQTLLAYTIIEMVKNSTVEQIEFMIKKLYNFNTADETIEAFFQMLGLEQMPVLNERAYEYFIKKLKNQERRLINASGER